MTRGLLLLAVVGCGSASAPARAPAAGTAARRTCVHGPAPVPASCIRSSARGTLLKDDAAAGLRIWQACDDGGIVDGSYVAERVGNGRKTQGEMIALFKARQHEVFGLGVIEADYRGCGGAGAPAASGDDADAGCIELGFQQPDEDVPAVAADLVRIFGATPGDDVCLAFRIDTGVTSLDLKSQPRP